MNFYKYCLADVDCHTVVVGVHGVLVGLHRHTTCQYMIHTIHTYTHT
jgi:hypothetical protein